MADVRTLTSSDRASASYAGVLRNTYMLLSLTLVWSAVTAYVSMQMQVGYMGFSMLIIYIALLFAVTKTQNSVWGLFWVFALTGFLGFTLGPILTSFIGAGKGGLITSSLGLTALVFVSLSAYSLITRKDFSFLRGFLMAGVAIIIGLWVLSIFIDLSVYQMAISGGMVLFASALILFQTSAIVHGGETNYISATVGLYVAIYSLFVHLLSILGIMDD